jgi:hypothetical protein
MVGLAAAGPFGWGVAATLIIGGTIANAYSTGLFDNFWSTSPGYIKLTNWVDFGIGMGLSYVGGRVAYAPAKVLMETALRTQGVKLSTTFAQVYYNTAVKEYTIKTAQKNIFRNTIGKTTGEQIYNIVYNYGKQITIPSLIHTVSDRADIV